LRYHLDQEFHHERHCEEELALLHDPVDLWLLGVKVVMIIGQVAILVVQQTKTERVNQDQHIDESIEPGPLIDPNTELSQLIVKAKPIECLLCVAIALVSMANDVGLIGEVVDE
jgi:hypothetical protein